MAIYKRDIVDINLETGNIHRSFLKHSIGYLDQAADHFGIRVLRNGEPVDLTGVTVQGIFMPPQGSPIAITTGNIIEENVAEVVLPQACYNYDGQFCLSIKLVDATNAITGTMRIVDGMVDNTHASGTVAPTGAVPTYQEVLAVYDNMVAALVTVDELDDEVSDLKSAVTVHEESISNDFEQITGNKALVFTSGCYYPETVNAVGTLVSYQTNANDVCAICPCVKGDVFNVNVYGYTGKNRAWFICDSSMICLSKADTSVHLNGTFTITDNNAAYVVFNNYLTNMGIGYYAYKDEGLKTKLDPVINTFNSRPSSNIVEDLIAYSTAKNRTANGITYTKIEPWKWEISSGSGTATSDSFANLFNRPVVPGDLYKFVINGGVGIRVYLSIQGVDQNTINYTEDGEYILLMPDGIETMSVRFQISSGTSVDTTETIHVLHYTPTAAFEEGNPFVSYTERTLKGWKNGGFVSATGAYANTNTEIYKVFDLTETAISHIKASSGYKFIMYAWDGDTYKGTYRYGQFLAATGSELLSEFYLWQMKKYKKAYIAVRKTNGENIEPSEGENIIFTVAKSQHTLYPTGDNTDRTNEVLDMLNTYGVCNLEKGQYYLRNVDMPDGSTVKGNGFGSEVILIEDASSGQNIWTSGNISFTQSYGYVFDTPLQPGIYQISCKAESNDTDSTTCRVSMYFASPYVEANSYYKTIPRGTQETFELIVHHPIIRIEFDAASTYSKGAGDTASFTDISIIKSEYAFSLGTGCSVSDLSICGSATATSMVRPSTDGRRNGVVFLGSGNGTTEPNTSQIHNCLMYYLSGNCILLQETGYDSKPSVSISECVLRYSHAGIAIPRFSEFNRISNCLINGCYYGVLNNGGNNNFIGCNLVGNAYGFAIDNANGNAINNAHGGANSCNIQHSTINAVYVNGSGAGYVFTGCNIDDAGAEIINSCRIVFAGCNFMNTFSLSVSGVFVNSNTGDTSGLIIFSGCAFRDTFTTEKISIQNNDSVRFNGCYYSDGDLIDPYHPKTA